MAYLPLSLLSSQAIPLTLASSHFTRQPIRGCSISRTSLLCKFHLHSDLPKAHHLEEQSVREEEGEHLSRATLLWRAAKPPIYSVAIVPLSVGTASAFLKARIFHGGRFCVLLLSAMLVIAWLNLSNDVYDADTGVDKDKKESVVNITGSRNGVLYAAYSSLLLGIIGISWVALQADIKVVWLLAAAIACGYIYQCPPFRFSYKGLGEPLCFLAFGPLATTAFYLSQANGRVGAYELPLSGCILGASVLVGISTSLILFCSHFHQIEGDRSVGKISPLVRLGSYKGAVVVKAIVISIYLLLTVLSATRVLPLPCAIFSLPTLPVGRLVLDFVNKNHSNKEKIFMAKYYCVRLHVALGFALALGLLTTALMPTMLFR